MKQSLGAKTLLYPAPVLVVGTYGPDGEPNVMTAAWGGIACSKPPCVCVSLRAATASHGNIMARKAFTICIPGESHTAQADYVGLVSGRDHHKFDEAGLTPVRSELVDAPYVEEFPIALECKLTAVQELGLHTHFIGEVVDAKVDGAVLRPDGQVDLQLLRPILFSAIAGGYYGVGEFLGKSFSIGKQLGKKP